MNRRPMCLPKEKKRKGKRKEKEKKRKIKRRKIATLALKPEHSPRGIRRKSLKPGALNQGATDLVLATWVDGWSLASCRCWSFEIIRSPG